MTEQTIPVEESGNPDNPGQGEQDSDDIVIERIPWSELAPEFAQIWGRADTADPQPESMEVLGMNGSGKTLFVCKAVQERMIVRKTPCVFIQTKPDDKTILRLGWPVVDDPRRVRRERWCVYWPRTNKTGRERKAYQAAKIQQLLDYLWHKDSNIIVVFDDFGYTQSLNEDIRQTTEMYLREGRSSGITSVMIKQRPQRATREMHSETYWTVAFVPKDRQDMERFAELYGRKQEWMPVFDQMDPDRHEFLIKHARSRAVYISWIDTPLVPIKRPERGDTPRQ
jgi:hypothetical protein